MATRTPSTGRRPALEPAGIRSLLTRYFAEDGPGVAALAAEFEVTPATVRRYLKAAGLTLPRGRAASLPRERQSVSVLMNRMSVQDLLGPGRTELLRRRLQAGESISACAEAFDLSRRRVSQFRQECLSESSSPESPSESSSPES